MKTMIRVPVIALLCCSLLACKKLVEETRKNAFIEAMTNGQWVVDQFMEGTISSTDQFTGFQFQFNDDGTLTGISDAGSVSGLWIGDIPNYAINSLFPEAGDPLKKLNGTWKITSARSSYVNAEMTTTEGKKILRLRKA